MKVDVAIVGAGPVGLCFARALAMQGFSVTLIEKQARASLAEPAFDGREIAMTHASRRTLETLGIWQRIAWEDVSPLRDARVLDGPSPQAMTISARDGGGDQLGYLVTNQLIRKTAYDAAMETPGVSLRDGTTVKRIEHHDDHVRLWLSDGDTLHTRLLVASDNRFSETRRQMGIGAYMNDFGKTMLVCRVEHEKAHDHVAWEWFDYGQTMALLPLHGHQASVVLTQTHQQSEVLAGLDDDAFADNVTQRFLGRLGQMRPISTRHLYPLVGVYAHRFSAPRFALIGDAAVGMHPVTAHGFNFGLLSVERLADLIATAGLQADIGASALLKRYECGHRRATLPLYLATYAVASLYTDDRTPARLLRRAALRVADRMLPFKRAIAAQLTHSA